MDDQQSVTVPADQYDSLRPDPQQQAVTIPADQYDSLRPAQGQPVTVSADQYDSLRPDEEEPSEPKTSMLGAAAAGAVHSAGAAAGAIGGAALGQMAIPIPIVGGLIGAGVGGYLGAKAQRAGEEALGTTEGEGFLSDKYSQAAQKEYPITSFAGELAPNALAFEGASAKLAARMLAGGIFGATEAGQEYVNEGKIDPLKTAIAAGAGALLPNERPWLRDVKARIGLGHAAPQDTTVADTASASIDAPAVADPSASVTATSDNRGNAQEKQKPPGAASTADDRSKAPTPAPGEGMTTGDPNKTPDIVAATDALKPAEPAPPTETPAPPPAEPAPQGEPVYNPGLRDLPQAQPAEAPKADNTQTVVSIANSAKDGTVYIDKSIPELSPTLKTETGEPLNLHQPLIAHETAEKANMDQGYDKAHDLGKAAERAEVERQGGDWSAYSKEIAGFGSHIEKQEQTFTPESGWHVDPNEAIGHYGAGTVEPEAAPQPTMQAMARSRGFPGKQGQPALLEELGQRAEKLSGGEKEQFRNTLRQAWSPLRTLRQLFSPQSMTPESEMAGAATREVHGQRRQADAQAEAVLVNAQRVANSAPAKEVNDFLKGFENNTIPQGNVFSSILPDIKKAMDMYKARLQKLPEGDNINFLEHYFPRSGLWDMDDPGFESAVRNFFTKQGSKSPLKEREFLTIPQGLAAGMKFSPDILRPDGVPDPMKIIGKYMNQMGNYTESQEMLGRYIKDGIARVHDITKEADRVFPGEVRLEGRTYRGLPVYAPKEVAEVFNNFYSPGVHANEAAGNIYDTWMHGKNMMSALKLLGGGYHAMAIGTESMISRFATGLAAAVKGDPEGFKQMATSPAAPISHYLAGKKGRNAFLYGSADPQTQTAVDALRDAGFDFSAKGQISQNPELQYAAGKSFFKSFQEGRLALDAAEAKQRVSGALARNPIAGGAQMGKEAFAVVGRAMQSVMHPLFEHYIPLVKNGAAIEAMGSYLKNNPNASREEMLQAARRVSDSIDNRLGIIHQDNVFWNRTLKQAAQASMLSWGWNFGTVREIGGGALKALRSPGSLSVTHRDYDPRVAYVIAMPILTTVMASVYQMLKTGKTPDEPPHSIGEAFTGKTGGTAARSAKDERAILPGYQKDVLGAWNNIFNPSGTGSLSKELYNKLAPAIHLGVETLTNQDWSGHPIWDPNHPFAQKLAEYFHHVGASLGPIAAEQAMQMNRGTNISVPERLAGIRPAGADIQKPEATRAAIAKHNEREWKAKLKFDQRMAQ